VKKLTALIISTILAAAIAAAMAAPAFSWHYRVTGMASCNASTGKYDVRWTIDNTSENQSLTVLTSNRSAVPAGSKVAAYATRTFNESIPGNTSGATSLNLTVNWPGDTAAHYQSASVYTDGKCSVPSGPKPPVQTTGPCSVDVAVVKTTDEAEYKVGDQATYTVSVSNVEQDYCVATDVAVQDSLPAQFMATSVSDPRCSINGQQLTCELGDLQSTFTGGQPVVFTVSGHMTAASDSVANQACVSSVQADDNTSNNCSTVTVKVSAPPAKTPTPAPAPKPKPKPAPKPHKPVKHKPVKHHKKPRHHARPPKVIHYTP
jgi:uncharacterized repeat protein (TIGR01451 family)